MVGVKRKVVNIIADPSHPSSANSLHSNSIDRRTKAVRSCSNWNSALLHGRRTRGPQWDYATASYHVSKGSAEYYKGVTRIQSSNQLNPNPARTSSTAAQHPSASSNHYGLNSSSSQFNLNHQNHLKNGSINPTPSHAYNLHPTTPFQPLQNNTLLKNNNLTPPTHNPGMLSYGHNNNNHSAPSFPANMNMQQPRVSLNHVPLLNQHAHPHSHSFPTESEQQHQFQANRLRPTGSLQHSAQGSSHAVHTMGHAPTQVTPYTVHPSHLQVAGNQAGIPPPQAPSFNHHLSSNSNNNSSSNNNNHAIDSKSSGMFPNQGSNMVNPTIAPPKVITSPHFQLGPSPGAAPHGGIPRHMSTTPSLPPSQPDRKAEPLLSHPGGNYHHPMGMPANQQTLERTQSSQLGPAQQSFSPAQYYPH
ncbi:hypothetical protein PCANC_05061 [Puccinia coronata f. sp. avenae]|uniref:Uncharacterized protein n=1 Tax=Puccinia coronata f. sp. avenae TaxID=200324 RepID=A0A2N5T716_9BASI|nr:hypothetical protein PCANC_05061 [Puccinia coronata f. sp. avenae]